MLHSNMTVNAAGHLAFAGMDTIELAKKYGTPLYLMDENGIRQACREYKRNMKRFMGGASRPIYASKALSFVTLAKIMEEEEMDVEVVSPGEILVAIKGGIDPKNLYFI